MTIEQKKIFENLNLIGLSVANYYHDALMLINSDIQLYSKANVIAHLAREIDGSLRDIFAPSTLNKMEYVECKKRNSHLNSILVAIGKTDENDKFAQEWYEIASNFHRIAHRKDIHDDSKDPTEIINLWARYEKILDSVIGSFLAITTRIDVLLKLDKPDKQLLSSFNNLISNGKNANYLFSNLKEPLWLKDLRDIGQFEPESAPVQKDEKLFPEYWHQIKYLLNIAPIVRRNVELNFISIIENIMDAYVQEKIRLNPYVIFDLSDIILKTESMKFSKNEFDFFEKVSIKIHSNLWGFIHDKLIREMPKKLLKKEDRSSLLLLLKYFFGVRFIKIIDEKNIFEIENFGTRKLFNIDKYSLKHLIDIYGSEMTIFLGKEIFDIVIELIKKLHIDSPYSISSLSIPTIEVTNQSIYNDEIESVFVNFMRDYGSRLDESEFTALLNEILYSDVEILNRIGIHLLRIHFPEKKKIWWKFIASSNPSKRLCIHEPYLLLKENAISFNEKEIKKIITWIEKINIYSDETHRAYNIRRWLTAFNDISMPEKYLVDETKDKYEKINSSVLTEHPEYDSYFSFSSADKSPVSFEEFNNLDLANQIIYINDLKSDDDFNDNKESVAKLLQKSIEENPNKYLFQLSELLEFNSLYQYYIINALLNLLKQNKILDNNLLINYVELIINEKKFSQEVGNKFDYYSWLLSIIIDYIKYVLQNGKELIIEIYDLDLLIQLLIKLQELCDNENNIPQHGYINHLLNSNKGKVYDALIEAAKYNAIIFEHKDEGKSLPKPIKDLFTLKVQDKNNDLEFSIAISIFLPILSYLDISWVENFIPSIFDDSDRQKYDCRIICVFNRLFRLNKEYCYFLKNHSLFDKGLDLLKYESDSLDTLTYYSILEWKLWGANIETDSIISKIIKMEEPEQIKSLIISAIDSQLLTQEDVIKIWMILSEMFNKNIKFKSKFSIFNTLFNGINIINDENIFLLRELISNIHVDIDAYNFLRHLYKIADTNLKLSGELLLQIFKKGIVQPFFEDELFSIVEKIYNDNNFELANMICVEVSETGFLKLKQLYLQHN